MVLCLRVCNLLQLCVICSCYSVSWTLRASMVPGVGDRHSRGPAQSVAVTFCLELSDSPTAGGGFSIPQISNFNFMVTSFTFQGLPFWLPHTSVTFCPVIYQSLPFSLPGRLLLCPLLLALSLGPSLPNCPFLSRCIFCAL